VYGICVYLRFILYYGNGHNIVSIKHVSLVRLLLLLVDGLVVDGEKGAGHLVAQHRPVESVFVNVFVEAEGGRRLLPQDGGAQGVAAPRRRVRLRPRVHEIFEQTERLQRQRPAMIQLVGCFFRSNLDVNLQIQAFP
jgi:hypothetical protein